MNEEMQQKLIALVLAAMSGDQQATLQVNQIMQAAQQGNPLATLLAQMILQIAQQLQGLQALVAKLGAKINYIKLLRGKCPEGYEMQYFEKGGAFIRKCKKCQQGNTMPLQQMDVIGQFKCGRKMKKKACGGAVEKDKCGSKMKKKACGGPVKKDRKGGAVKPVKTVKTVITYPNQLEGQVRRVQYFDDGTQAVLNGGWSTDGTYHQTLRGRQGEFGDIYGTPRQQQIADSLKRVDWKDYGTGPVYVPALKKKSRTK